MQFSFEVGEQERHRVDFSLNWFWGNVAISVDGKVVQTDQRIASITLIKRYELSVGDKEEHDVVIEMERKLLLAAFRARKYRIFVDGKLIAEHEGR